MKYLLVVGGHEIGTYYDMDLVAETVKMTLKIFGNEACEIRITSEEEEEE